MITAALTVSSTGLALAVASLGMWVLIGTLLGLLVLTCIIDPAHLSKEN